MSLANGLRQRLLARSGLAARCLASGSGGRKKTTAMSLGNKKRRGLKISMCTAYDFPSARHVELAGMDILLVGDSLGMVELGYDTTQPVTLDEMLHHCKAVARGASLPLLVGDMPLGSYEVNDEEALRNAYRFIKEGGMDAIKIEGGRKRAETARKIVDGGIAVMAHVGLTPQAISVIGGFRAQGRTAVKARQLLDDALAMQDAGAVAVVLECVPAPVGKAITDALEIPTIGIGAGRHTSGQVLVYHDLLGMMHHPHHEQFVPQFCKRYAKLGEQISSSLEQYRSEVESGAFPGEDYAPYKMSPAEEAAFHDLLRADEREREERLGRVKKSLIEQDEYESIGVYGAGGADAPGK